MQLQAQAAQQKVEAVELRCAEDKRQLNEQLRSETESCRSLALSKDHADAALMQAQKRLEHERSLLKSEVDSVGRRLDQAETAKEAAEKAREAAERRMKTARRTIRRENGS